MPLLRRDGAGARLDPEDPWTRLADDAPWPASGSVVVSLERFRAGTADAGDDVSVAVEMPGETDAEGLATELRYLSLVVIRLPKFTDGRAYSLARRLRADGFEGELRAGGAVLRDQLFYLARCGFDTFELADGASVDDAVGAFSDFSVTYQPAADHDEPIWRRRRGG